MLHTNRWFRTRTIHPAVLVPNQHFKHGKLSGPPQERAAKNRALHRTRFILTSSARTAPGALGIHRFSERRSGRTFTAARARDEGPRVEKRTGIYYRPLSRANHALPKRARPARAALPVSATHRAPFISPSAPRIRHRDPRARQSRTWRCRHGGAAALPRFGAPHLATRCPAPLPAPARSAEAAPRHAPAVTVRSV